MYIYTHIYTAFFWCWAKALKQIVLIGKKNEAEYKCLAQKKKKKKMTLVKIF